MYNLKNISGFTKFILIIILFWMGLFIFQQMLFLIFFTAQLNGIPYGHVLSGFWYAQRINISATCYLTILPVVFISAGIILKKPKAGFRIAKIFTIVMIVIVLMIGLFDLGLYSYWGTKLNSKALSFLAYPKEIAGMVIDPANLLYMVIFVVFAIAVNWLFIRLTKIPEIKKLSPGLVLIIFTLISGIMVILMRGGLQKYPLSKSSCYYSNHSVLNYAALNGFWNLTNLLASKQVKDNPYRFFSETEASDVVSGLYSVHKDTTVSLFNVEMPNFVLLMMESISADAIASLGGERGIMPEFDSIAAQGVLFTDFYATGFRTDQGVVAVLSSFPAQPATAIIKDFGKFEKLPNLVTEVEKLGYHTSFYYGGDISYANTSTYLTSAGIHYLAGVNEVPHTQSTDWGAYDEDLFSFYISDSINRPEPFFTVMLTLTNHEYFDAEVEKVFNTGKPNNGYFNTAYYTDKCIAKFLQDAALSTWYKNTVFIITSDHAHIYPMGRKYNEPGRHHIPLLIYGKPLKHEYRGIKISKTGSHIDIAPTLLSQLKLDPDQFRYGKNLFNPYTAGFAYYAFDNGFGFITSDGEVIYDHDLGKIISCSGTTLNGNCSEIEKQGKAFMEIVFRDYIDL